MATADIIKQSVFDARIQQNPARYAVDKGALSLTNSPYNAISASSSQHTYNINVPSQNVFVDRAIDWSARTLVQFNVAVDAAVRGAQPANIAAAQTATVINFGADVALSAFPLHEIVATLTATINDTSVTVNLDTVLHEVLRLTDYKKNRIPRTCPTMLDKYASYDDAYMGVNSPLGNYLQQPDTAEAPNGAWGQLEFCNASGVPLRTLVGPTAANNFYTASGVNVYFNASGIPVRTNDDIGAEPAQYPLFVSFFSNERLVLSPFIFADAHEYSTGLFGINNIQLVMNMKSGSAISRVLRSTTRGGSTVSSVALANFSATGSPFQDAKVNVQFLTPSLDLELPAKSIVPFTEFPRYISNNYASLDAGATTTLQSQTIVLPQIPDMLVIYCKPSAYSATEGDYYLPITKISVNFDNFAGLLSSHTTEQLYHMCVHNGLHMDYNAWRGKARGVMAPPGATAPVAGNVQTVGGFLVLKPGQDITLQAGQSPSLIGNFTFQAQVTVENTSAAAKVPVLYVMAVNSGFFETLAGSSRIIKGVLSEADIISAEPAPEGSRDQMERIVGDGFFSKLGSFLSKAKDIYSATKPAISQIKGMLPEGKVKDIMGKVGYGHAGAGMAGAGMAGAGRKSLSARLM